MTWDQAHSRAQKMMESNSRDAAVIFDHAGYHATQSFDEHGDSVVMIIAAPERRDIFE